MNKLNYSSFAELIADFERGAKFEIQGCSISSTNGPVTSLRFHADDGRVTTNNGQNFKLDGSTRYCGDFRLVKVAEAPVTPLPYNTAAELIAAFDAGAKFELQGSDNADFNGPVARIGLNDCAKPAGIQVWGPDNTGGWMNFRLDGSHLSFPRMRLVQVSNVPLPKIDPAMLPTTPVSLGGIKGVQLNPLAEPFLKQFLLGSPAYCPKTRETVSQVSFMKGHLSVLLTNGDGVDRESYSYDHTGKHKHDPERSLVLGELPALPKAPKAPRYTGAQLWDDAPYGLYSQASDGTGFQALAIRHSEGHRTVLFIQDGRVTDLLSKKAWVSTEFVLTDDRPVLKLK